MRVVCQHTPKLYSLGVAEDAAITPTFEYNGTTFYLAERHAHYVLYKVAVSGWGALAATPDPNQR